MSATPIYSPPPLPVVWSPIAGEFVIRDSGPAPLTLRLARLVRLGLLFLICMAAVGLPVWLIALEVQASRIVIL